MAHEANGMIVRGYPHGYCSEYCVPYSLVDSILRWLTLEVDSRNYGLGSRNGKNMPTRINGLKLQITNNFNCRMHRRYNHAVTIYTVITIIYRAVHTK